MSVVSEAEVNLLSPVENYEQIVAAINYLNWERWVELVQLYDLLFIVWINLRSGRMLVTQPQQKKNFMVPLHLH